MRLNDSPLSIHSLRGLQVEIKGKTMVLHFYYDEKISEEEKEEISILATELFAQFGYDFLKEEYIRIDFPELLPQSPYLSYIWKE